MYSGSSRQQINSLHVVYVVCRVNNSVVKDRISEIERDVRRYHTTHVALRNTTVYVSPVLGRAAPRTQSVDLTRRSSNKIRQRDRVDESSVV